MIADGQIGIVHVGLGQIGRNIVRCTAERRGLRSVAAVDPNSALVGKSLADFCGDGAPAIRVHDTITNALAETDAQVAFHAVASKMATVEQQLLELIEAGLHVVTTAEELIWPYRDHEDAVRRVDDAARERGVTIVSAGVNPGALMDRLPVYLSSLCVRVDGVRVYRLVDLARRRPALRRKMGVGLPLEEVSQRIAEHAIGHVGLQESVLYLASGLGWKIGPINETLRAETAQAPVSRAGENVAAGDVVGLDHTAVAITDAGQEVRLHLVMRLDATEPVDEIVIDGEPPLCARFIGGVDGDVATAATVLNAARFAVDAPAGLMARIPMPHADL